MINFTAERQSSAHALGAELTIPNLLRKFDALDEPALLAADADCLSRADLFAISDAVQISLAGKGCSLGSRVGSLLSGGPIDAAILIGAMSSAACVPLNPATPAREVIGAFSSLGVGVVLIRDDYPWVQELTDGGLEIISASQIRSSASEHKIEPQISFPPKRADDIALIMRTSGTTSGPKTVALSQEKICLAARNMQSILRLTPEDRCLNAMPLFHTHGLVTAVISALASGGSIVCQDSFVADDFFTWTESFRPSWFTGVPAMYQAILAAAQGNNWPSMEGRFRVVRSSSAPLPPAVAARVESFFGAPLIETYGITEASVVASNPMPPRQQKRGSVGLPTAAEIEIVSEDGATLPNGELGEIKVRGPMVIDHYDGNPSASEAAFRNGWFHTGDLGYFDSDGYLFIAGRTGETLKRGGNRVSLLDIENALTSLEGIAEAVAYPVPHPTLGSDIHAGVVLQKGSLVTGERVRSELNRITDSYKVPTRIRVIYEIPRTATGKIDRKVIPDELTFLDEIGQSPPQTKIEIELAALWSDFLSLPSVYLEDNFFDLGGDSLQLVMLLSKMEEHFNVRLSAEHIIDAPCLGKIAAEIAILQSRAL
ncbi:non-ribosomal peptide synthetase [Sphingobium sp. TomTYG45]